MELEARLSALEIAHHKAKLRYHAKKAQVLARSKLSEQRKVANPGKLS